jgi:hypothetical protein
MDIYRDYFTREQLLLSLANSQYIPRMLGETGLFRTIGMNSTTMGIEALPDNNVAESAEIPRGGPPKSLMLEKRVVEPFTAKTYAWTGAVMADEVLNMRAAGTSGAVEVIQQRINEQTAMLRNQADFQHEYLRVACLNTPTNAFGSVGADQTIAFGVADTVAVHQSIHQHITLRLEAALGGLPYGGVDVYCSDAFWQGLIQSKSMRETYLNTAAASQLRGIPMERIDYGNVSWWRYRASGNIAITSGEAKAVPRGVPGLFVQAFAPNDTVDSVGAGAIGQPYYLFSRPIETAAGIKGYQMTLQTHPVMVCTRPSCVLTVSLS